MDLYIVMVRTPVGARYPDSFWISAPKAEERRSALLKNLQAGGTTTWTVWTADARIEDAALAK